MISSTTEKFWKLYEQLDTQTQKQAVIAYKLFSENIQHPSLKFKKLNTKLPIYSARINLNYRAVGIVKDDEIIWFWIGTHDAYIKLLAQF